MSAQEFQLAHNPRYRHLLPVNSPPTTDHRRTTVPATGSQDLATQADRPDEAERATEIEQATVGIGPVTSIRPALTITTSLDASSDEHADRALAKGIGSDVAAGEREPSTVTASGPGPALAAAASTESSMTVTA